MKILNLRGLKDETLSPNAKKLFDFLVHCAWNPDKYDLSSESLANHMNMGVEKIHTSLSELQSAKYLEWRENIEA